ncbi:MAG TPA: helix-turn-helix transcriptional regulator, partial [Candidatus Limnocylindrales bacterium]
RRQAIGDELRRLREDAGASKSAVSKLAGIDASYLTLIEQGRREPTGSVLGRVAAALGADVRCGSFLQRGRGFGTDSRHE